MMTRKEARMRTWRCCAVAALLSAAASAKDGGLAIAFLEEKGRGEEERE